MLAPGDPRGPEYFPGQSHLAVHPPAKYDLDLFYIAPFYHRFLHQLDIVIAVDLDVEFR